MVTFIAGDLLPVSTMESKRFCKMMNKAHPQYQVLSRNLTSKVNSAKITKTQQDLFLQLQKADKVCATIDLWSTSQMRSYFGVTGHFIVDWVWQSVMFACRWFHGSHTADAITKQFDRITATFDLTNKISYIVTDNAANMLKVFTPPGFEDVAVPHAISNDSSDDADDVKDGFKHAAASNKVLAKTAAIMCHVCKSIHAAELLDGHQRIQAASATQWNFQFSMVRSVLWILDDKLRSLDMPAYSVWPEYFEGFDWYPDSFWECYPLCAWWPSGDG